MADAGRPASSPAVVLREQFAGWAVLFSRDAADAVGINPVGVRIWKLMDGRYTVGEIVEEVEPSHNRVPESEDEQVRALAEDLARQGLRGDG